MGRQAARMGQMRNSYKIFTSLEEATISADLILRILRTDLRLNYTIDRYEGKRSLGVHSHRLEHNTKTPLK